MTFTVNKQSINEQSFLTPEEVNTARLVKSEIKSQFMTSTVRNIIIQAMSDGNTSASIYLDTLFEYQSDDVFEAVRILTQSIFDKGWKHVRVKNINSPNSVEISWSVEPFEDEDEEGSYEYNSL